MRVIKFRGKSISDSEWVYGFFFITQIGHFVGSFNEEVQCFSNSIGQFTGLKDKNGVDIYEGDILQEDNGSISFVIWFRTGYALQSPGSEAIDIEYSSYYSKVKIIGNIHANPELLK